MVLKTDSGQLFLLALARRSANDRGENPKNKGYGGFGWMAGGFERARYRDSSRYGQIDDGKAIKQV